MVYIILTLAVKYIPGFWVSLNTVRKLFKQSYIVPYKNIMPFYLSHFKSV